MPGLPTTVQGIVEGYADTVKDEEGQIALFNALGEIVTLSDCLIVPLASVRQGALEHITRLGTWHALLTPTWPAAILRSALAFPPSVALPRAGQPRLLSAAA